MKRLAAFHPGMTMDGIMRRWPQTIAVVHAHKMFCIGCPIAGFHTVVDACREHGVDEDAFIEELKQAISPQRKKA